MCEPEEKLKVDVRRTSVEPDSCSCDKLSQDHRMQVCFQKCSNMSCGLDFFSARWWTCHSAGFFLLCVATMQNDEAVPLSSSWSRRRRVEDRKKLESSIILDRNCEHTL